MLALHAAGERRIRALARAAAMHPRTVQSILDGTWAGFRRPPPIEPRQPQRSRCTECGAMVEMPCRACQVRAQLRRAGEVMRRIAAAAEADTPTTALDLRPTHDRRYRAVREARIAAERAADPRVSRAGDLAAVELRQLRLACVDEPGWWSDDDEEAA